MSKTRKLQDYAEDFTPSQSDEMEVQPQGDGTSSEMLKAARQMTASSDTIIRNTETIGLAVDGIGRYLLNEDGTVRDFTNIMQLKAVSQEVKDGLKAITTSAENIGKKVDSFPRSIEHTHNYSEYAIDMIETLNKNLRFERIMTIVGVALAVVLLAITGFRAAAVSDKSAELAAWYEKNRKAVVFGQYLRLKENDRWRYWQEQWKKDPGLDKQMYEYYMLEDWEKAKAKDK